MNYVAAMPPIALHLHEIVSIGIDIFLKSGRLAVVRTYFKNAHPSDIYMYLAYSQVHIVCSYSKVTTVYSKILLMKSSENDFIFLPAFYLIMCLMKAPKNF